MDDSSVITSRLHVRIIYCLIVLLIGISVFNSYLYLNYSSNSICSGSVNLQLRAYENGVRKLEDRFNTFHEMWRDRLNKRSSNQQSRCQIKIYIETEKDQFSDSVLLTDRYCIKESTLENYFRRVANYSVNETLRLRAVKKDVKREIRRQDGEKDYQHSETEYEKLVNSIISDRGWISKNKDKIGTWSKSDCAELIKELSRLYRDEIERLENLFNSFKEIVQNKSNKTSEIANDCEITAFPQAIKVHGTYSLTGNFCVEKSFLKKYVLQTVDLCKGFNQRQEGQKEGSRQVISRFPEINIPSDDSKPKDCVLEKIEEEGSFFKIPDEVRGRSFLLTTDPFGNDSENEFSVWIKEFLTPNITEYRFKTSGQYEIVSRGTLPDEFYKYGFLYNGSFFSEYKEEKRIAKYNLKTNETSKVKELDDGYFFNDNLIFFYADEYGVWTCYYTRNSAYVVLRIDPKSMAILSKQIVPANCYLYRFFVASGRIYCVSEQEDQITLLSDFFSRDNRNVSINFHPNKFARYRYLFSYNYRSQYLYVYDENIFMRYKLYFNCSN
ncbi:uncharacterized protein LOC111621158 [Centruroides sculpturatus]|uniref:uncharacterized protein LOC111621158 n=1 Tax=Centruroides sculpturatus TaxID=218467 RepID=UPI000C6EBBDF|nr:uncharacterized protein LOC111621158 [Centruroides sculpturatus]